MTTTRRPAPDIRIRQLATWLDLYATETATAEAVLAERSARAAAGIGHGTNTNDIGRVHTSRGSSTTETRALNAVAHREQHDQIGKHIAAIAEAIRIGRHYIHLNIMQGPDLPAEPKPPRPCKEGQHGKAGAIIWGDPTCDFPADKSALCGTHYQAWRRHRNKLGIDTSGDFAAA